MICPDVFLKRFREAIDDYEIRRAINDYGNGWYPFSGEELKAILVRLEAAEKAVEYADGCDKGEIDACEARLAIKEWRKAAGK